MTDFSIVMFSRYLYSIEIDLWKFGKNVKTEKFKSKFQIDLEQNMESHIVQRILRQTSPEQTWAMPKRWSCRANLEAFYGLSLFLLVFEEKHVGCFFFEKSLKRALHNSFSVVSEGLVNELWFQKLVNSAWEKFLLSSTVKVFEHSADWFSFCSKIVGVACNTALAVSR